MIARLPLALAAMLLFSACGPSESRLELEFAAYLNGQPIGCENTNPTLTDLRLYVTDMHFLHADGQQSPLSMQPRNRTQNEKLALVDLENRAGDCVNGTAETHHRVTVHGVAEDVVGIGFTVGVPFALNHQDPLTASAPLGDPDMHWHWRGGYKFLRAGVTDGDRSVWIHLGSTGCEGTIQNITGCSAPNRLTIELTDFSPVRDVIAIELDALLEAAVEPGVTSCSSGPAETSCKPMFEALGLSGESPQRVFTVQPRS